MSQTPPSHAQPGQRGAAGEPMPAPGWNPPRRAGPSAAAVPSGGEAHPGMSTGKVLTVVGLILLAGAGLLAYVAGAEPEEAEPSGDQSDAAFDGPAASDQGAGRSEPGEGPGPGEGSGPAGGEAVPATTTSSLPVTAPPAPARAAVGDCVAVTEQGDLLGTGPCAGGGTPYRVVEVVEAVGSCSDPESASVPSGDQRLCLEANLVESYCYVFPEGDGFITVAPACEAPGTVHVIQVVPGAADGAACTTSYEWNWYYPFTSPRMVACVMRY